MCRYIWIYIITTFFTTQAKTELWRSVGYHPAWRILDSTECGFSAADRIIGGLNAALGQFPWVTRLGYLIPGEPEIDWMCGGVLVTDRHVITAAHCVPTAEEEAQLLTNPCVTVTALYETELAGCFVVNIDVHYLMPGTILMFATTIRIGEYDTSTNPDCQLRVCAPPLQDRRIKSIITHPNYNKPAFHNDIAIILLDRPVQLNDYVLPICLPRGDQLVKVQLGESVTVAGWGKMNMTTEERARILQYVALPVVQPEVCNSFGRGFRLSTTEICAGAQQNRDACGGDSGGPLMKVFDTPDGPKNVLVGVVSFGPTICGIKKPGVYTSVPHFIKWILDNVMK